MEPEQIAKEKEEVFVQQFQDYEPANNQNGLAKVHITVTTLEKGQVQQLYLAMVDLKPHYCLAKSSIGQIVFSLQNILSVVPKSDYEKKLYVVIIPEIKKLLDQYNSMLIVQSYPAMLVRYYNLLVGLPSKVSIFNEEHGRIKMKNPKLGSLIKAGKQRLSFIISRKTPDIYLINTVLADEFTKLQADCQLFYDNLLNFEKIFVKAVREAKRQVW
ncbi:MAG: hypothetical protein Barrevirus3_13 [Barrevirus sp.]|uniref:Uncharacterized protein n=1 Tax=Barrevirus sp. TaxID=2487763 RepID=A0A3G4ZTG2_9VIRU|nr:MAG: hypothetical protein Barrevirus3_13 [Barrevirus sp.]